mgnify:CR=1 FL=1
MSIKNTISCHCGACSLKLNEPMVWCPNNEKTSCVSSPRSKKPIGCIGDFSKEQCERSRLTKIKVQQNSPVVNTLVTQRTQQRNTGFRREAPKAWCPKIGKGKARRVRSWIWEWVSIRGLREVDE